MNTLRPSGSIEEFTSRPLIDETTYVPFPIWLFTYQPTTLPPATLLPATLLPDTTSPQTAPTETSTIPAVETTTDRNIFDIFFRSESETTKKPKKVFGKNARNRNGFLVKSLAEDFDANAINDSQGIVFGDSLISLEKRKKNEDEMNNSVDRNLEEFELQKKLKNQKEDAPLSGSKKIIPRRLRNKHSDFDFVDDDEENKKNEELNEFYYVEEYYYEDDPNVTVYTRLIDRPNQNESKMPLLETSTLETTTLEGSTTNKDEMPSRADQRGDEDEITTRTNLLTSTEVTTTSEPTSTEMSTTTAPPTTEVIISTFSFPPPENLITLTTSSLALRTTTDSTLSTTTLYSTTDETSTVTESSEHFTTTIASTPMTDLASTTTDFLLTTAIPQSTDIASTTLNPDTTTFPNSLIRNQLTTSTQISDSTTTGLPETSTATFMSTTLDTTTHETSTFETTTSDTMDKNEYLTTILALDETTEVASTTGVMSTTEVTSTTEVPSTSWYFETSTIDVIDTSSNQNYETESTTYKDLTTSDVTTSAQTSEPSTTTEFITETSTIPVDSTTFTSTEIPTSTDYSTSTTQMEADTSTLESTSMEPSTLTTEPTTNPIESTHTESTTISIGFDYSHEGSADIDTSTIINTATSTEYTTETSTVDFETTSGDYPTTAFEKIETNTFALTALESTTTEIVTVSTEIKDERTTTAGTTEATEIIDSSISDVSTNHQITDIRSTEETKLPTETTTSSSSQFNRGDTLLTTEKQLFTKNSPVVKVSVANAETDQLNYFSMAPKQDEIEYYYVYEEYDVDDDNDPSLNVTEIGKSIYKQKRDNSNEYYVDSISASREYRQHSNRL